MLQSLPGFLCVDKPIGRTSRDLVNIVQRRINVGREKGNRIKVGHTGTLDPLASGVLVLGVGAAVRLTNQVGAMKKTYDATFRLNQRTDSGDLDGLLTEHDLPIPTESELSHSAAKLVGQIEQVPPAHSAIHVDGVRAYKRVRAGESVVMPPRTVQIDSIVLTRFDPPEFDFVTVCGGGTYIRTLGMDIAAGAASVAVMTRLCRTAVGPFDLAGSVDIETLRHGDLQHHLQPIVSAVIDMPKINVTEAADECLFHGISIGLKDASPLEESIQTTAQSEVAAIGPAGDLRAIVVRRGVKWKPIRVFAAER